MRKSRFTDGQFLLIVYEVDAGATQAEVTRRHGIRRATLRRWHARYQNLGLAEAKRLKAREDENRRLKKLVPDLSLDNQLLNEMVGRKW